MRRFRILLVGVACTGMLLADTGTAWAGSEPETMTTPALSLTGPASVRAGAAIQVSGMLTGVDSGAVAQAPVSLQERVRTGADSSGATWQERGHQVTDETGSVDFSMRVKRGPHKFRLVFVGDADRGLAASTSVVLVVHGKRLPSRLRLRGPARLLDGHRAQLRVRWRTSDGLGVRALVRVQKRTSGHWRTRHKVRTNNLGRAHLKVRPRQDSTWRLVGRHGEGWKHAASPTLRIDNVPPGVPVHYPAKAPRPARLPAQGHATGNGAHPVIGKIPGKVWRSMVGRSWHAGCPVGRAGLRLLRINYWDFDGYRRRGEMVLRTSVAGRASRALAEMYRHKFPLRAMYRVDRFGWSSYLHGANDYASMRHDNSYAFNCRGVTGNPGVRSPHSYGTAIDLNTWENPYHSARGIVPNRWWAYHSAPRITWRSLDAPVVRIWLRHGFHWTYRNADSQHMDARSAGVQEGTFVAD